MLTVNIADESCINRFLVDAKLLHPIVSISIEDLLFVLLAFANGLDEQIVREIRLIGFGYNGADILNTFITSCRRVTWEIGHHTTNIFSLDASDIELAGKNRRSVRKVRRPISRLTKPNRVHHRVLKIFKNLKPQQIEIVGVSHNKRQIDIGAIVKLKSLRTIERSWQITP